MKRDEIDEIYVEYRKPLGIFNSTECFFLPKHGAAREKVIQEAIDFAKKIGTDYRIFVCEHNGDPVQCSIDFLQK